MKLKSFWLIVFLCVSNLAIAKQYLSIADAQKTIFASADEFKQVKITLNSEQEKLIKKASSTGTPLPTEKVYQVFEQGKPVGWFLIDEVYGKHEFITYAVGINLDGTVRMIDILDYRETYGYQVRDASWRQQFVGKTMGNLLKVGKDIDNISGATLSCKHMADGVKRVLAMYDVALKNRT